MRTSEIFHRKPGYAQVFVGFWGFVERVQLRSIAQPHMVGDIGDISAARLAHFNRVFRIG